MEENVIILSQEGRASLQGAAKWMKFLGIMVWLLVAIMILFGVAMLFGGAALQDPALAAMAITTVPMGIMYLIFAAIYAYIAIKLCAMAKYANIALRDNDQVAYDLHLQNQKDLYLYLGILTIIGIVFVVLTVIAAIIIGASAAALY